MRLAIPMLDDWAASFAEVASNKAKVVLTRGDERHEIHLDLVAKQLKGSLPFSQPSDPMRAKRQEARVTERIATLIEAIRSTPAREEVTVTPPAKKYLRGANAGG